MSVQGSTRGGSQTMMAKFITTRGDPPADCKAVVISRALWRQRGALALRRRVAERGEEFVIDAARSRNFDRPWWRARLVRDVVRHVATPRQEDIETDR